MKRCSRTRRVLRNGGTVVCAFLLLLFVCSTGRVITWTSPSLTYQVNVLLGSVHFAWRPEGWSLENDPYAGQAGWSISTFFGATWVWWVRSEGNKAWSSVAVPLWLPTLVLALPTAFLWYRDRRVVRQRLHAVVEWLRPVRRKRFTFWLVVSFSAIHGILAFVGIVATICIRDFVIAYRQVGRERPFDVFVDWAIPCVFWATPLWSILWAWLYVRIMNHLARRSTQPRCFECGYDLTGNVTGVCPECGKACCAKPAASGFERSCSQGRD